MNRSSRKDPWTVSVIHALILTILTINAASCRTATPPKVEPTTEYWTNLSDPMKDRLRKELTQDQLNAFQKLVQEACLTSAFAECVCCGNLVGVCNPTSWDCCASVVFVPSDGSSCSFPPGPCLCTQPAPS